MLFLTTTKVGNLDSNLEGFKLFFQWHIWINLYED